MGVVDVSGANSLWIVGNHFTIGAGNGRGIVRLSDGGNLTVNSWVDIGINNNADGRLLVGSGSTFSFKESLTLGSSLAGTSPGTLYVSEGDGRRHLSP